MAAVFIPERSFGCQRISFDCDIDFGSLFKLHLPPIRIGQVVRNADLAIEAIRFLDRDLGFFGFIGASTCAPSGKHRRNRRMRERQRIQYWHGSFTCCGDREPACCTAGVKLVEAFRSLSGSMRYPSSDAG
jgi:hypothetical protein